MTRKATMTDAIDKGVHNKLKGVNTAIPGYVLNFDVDTQLVEIQVAIERIDLNGNAKKWSPIIACPVHFPGCAFSVEYQVDIGSEGLVVFSQRCIDAWVDQGGVAPQSRIQFHDLNDAMFIPGVRSQPKKLQDFQNNGIRLRNEDGSNYIWLKNDSTAEITVTSLTLNGEFIHNGSTTQTGDTTSTGTVTGQTEVVGNGKSLSTHGHPQGNDSANDVQQNTGAPL